MLDLVPEEVVDMWLTKDKGSITVHEFDCAIEFGYGGLHGVHKHIKRAENVKLLDVTSLYPNIILNINALGSATAKYKEILDKRIEVLKLADPFTTRHWLIYPEGQDAVYTRWPLLISKRVYRKQPRRYSVLVHNPAKISKAFKNFYEPTSNDYFITRNFGF